MSADLASLFPGETGNRIATTFRMMGVCEEELARAQIPKAAQSLVFKHACPSPVLRDHGGEELYRAHVRELIRRAQLPYTRDESEQDPDMLSGTLAECLALMTHTSLQAPLNRAGQATAEWLFLQLFPKDANRVLGPKEDRAREVHPEQIAEDVATMRRKLKREEP